MRPSQVLLPLVLLVGGYVAGNLAPLVGGERDPLASVAAVAAGEGAPRARAPRAGGGLAQAPRAEDALPVGAAPAPARTAIVAGTDEPEEQAPEAADPDEPPAVADAGAVDRLFAHFDYAGRLLHASRTVRRNLLRVAQFTSDTYRYDGRLSEASEVLRLAAGLVGARSLDRVHARAFDELVEAFVARGERAAAAELVLEALRGSPDDDDLLELLREVDPVASRELVERQLAEADGDAYETLLLELDLAGLMAQGGDVDGARAILDELVRGRASEDALELYLSIDPEGARELLEADPALDRFGELRTQLAHRCLDDEDAEAALELVRGVVQELPRHGDALDLWAELDPEGCLAHMRAVARSEPQDAAFWEEYGYRLAAADEQAEAIAAYVASIQRDFWDDGAAEQLLELAPELLWSTAVPQVEASGDDERWGDLADLYWRAGRVEEAVAAWERARTLDPDDSEWIDKLRHYQLGLDPADAW